MNAGNQATPERMVVDKGSTCKTFAASLEKKGEKEKEAEIKMMTWGFKQTKKHSIQVPLPSPLLPASQANAFVIDYPNKLKPEVS